MNIELNNNEAALIDAALSLLHQNMVAQIGAIKEGINTYGDKGEENELLKGAQEVKADIELLNNRINIIQQNELDKGKLKKFKKFKHR